MSLQCVKSSSLNFLPCTLKILYIFRQNASASGALRPQTPDWGSAPGPRWGTPVPQTPWPPSENLWLPFAPQLWQPGAATENAAIQILVGVFTKNVWTWIWTRLLLKYGSVRMQGCSWIFVAGGSRFQGIRTPAAPSPPS